MTINAPDLYMAGIWDWAILDGCFGRTKIKPTDVDGLVERKGKFLMLETKAPGAAIPEGQRLTHQAWVAQGNSVIVVWGDTNKPQRILAKSPSNPEGKLFENASLATLRGLVEYWFQEIERNSQENARV